MLIILYTANKHSSFQAGQNTKNWSYTLWPESLLIQTTNWAYQIYNTLIWINIMELFLYIVITWNYREFWSSFHAVTNIIYKD